MTPLSATELQRRLTAIWSNLPGWRSATAVNHTTIGLRFIVTGFIFFLIGGVLAMVIRSQLAFADNDLVDHQAYAQAFTMHGTTMMFFFAVPIMEGIAAYLIPKMIGARDLIFPRLSAFGYWCYLFGGILLYSSFFFGTVPDGGWFMYVPLNDKTFAPGPAADFWLLGVTFAEISAVAAAVELIVSILKTRTPGMSLDKMPLYAWYILVTAFMIVFAFPPLILASILLEIERAFGLVFFDANRGGDPLLWQHLFWLFGHPEVYIIFLPAAGLVTTILPTFARRPIAGYSLVVLAVISTGFLSFGLWVHHMFAVGIPLLSLAFFSAASMAVAIPSGIQVFSWIATLWGTRPRLTVPMLYILGFLFIFVLGGLTGVMVALVPFDWQVHDTHFVVAHLHYVLFGGMVFPLFAALYYWLPQLSGRLPSERLSRLAFWMIFLGFNLTFLPMHLTGMVGMPRRVYTYAPELGWEALNLVSTVGSFLSAAGVGMLVIDLLLHYLYGRRASANPWQASTLEWAMATPVPPYNFASQPQVGGRDPLWDEPALAERIAAGDGYLGHAPTRRETLVTGTVDAAPKYMVILPGNTWTPLVAASFTGLFFIGFLAGLYWLAAIGAALAVGALFFWVWQSADGADGENGDDGETAARIDIGHGATLPTHADVSRPPGWWGMLFALMADATLFGSLVFAYLFLWTVSPAWPPAGIAQPEMFWPAVGFAVLVAGAVALGAATAALRRGHLAGMRLGYIAAAVCAVIFIALQAGALHAWEVRAGAHAYASLVYTTAGVQIAHVALAALMAGYLVLRARVGKLSAKRPGPAHVVNLFWQYTVLQWLLGFAVIYLFPIWMGA